MSRIPKVSIPSLTTNIHAPKACSSCQHCTAMSPCPNQCLTFLRFLFYTLSHLASSLLISLLETTLFQLIGTQYLWFVHAGSVFSSCNCVLNLSNARAWTGEENELSSDTLSHTCPLYPTVFFFFFYHLIVCIFHRLNLFFLIFIVLYPTVFLKSTFESSGYLFFYFILFIYLFFWLYWCLNAGPQTCNTDTLPLQSLCLPCFVLGIFETGPWGLFAQDKKVSGNDMRS
jgi:hypothetical protein